jgi:hypothetical protein
MGSYFARGSVEEEIRTDMQEYMRTRGIDTADIVHALSLVLEFYANDLKEKMHELKSTLEQIEYNENHED